MQLQNPFWQKSKALEALFEKLDGQARFVGGTVRDCLLGKTPADIDLATPFTPEQTAALLKEYTVIPTGLAFGTQTVLIDDDRFKSVEITALRQDVAPDGRRTTVAFSANWETDAARRDFTINALSADFDGRVFDYFGGIGDLQNGVVRFIGRPEARIAEDYLRILRYFRFLARFSKHSADAGVLAVCERLSAGLDKVSPERACEEIRKILNCRKAGIALRAMNQAGILSRWFPEADLDTFDRLSTDCPAARWSILGKSPLYRYLPRESKRRLALFLPAAETPFEAAFLLRNNPLKDVALQALDARFPEAGLLAAQNITVPPYPISGKDLTFMPKRFIGKALTAAQDFWIKKQGAPDKAALLEFVKNLNFETNSDQSNRQSG